MRTPVGVTLLLVRHGETQWNRDHRWQGHSGEGLNDVGRQQAREVAEQLDDVQAIYSSDAQRAVETAEIIAGRFDLPVATDPRLREVDFGEWEGLTRDEIDGRYDQAVTRWETKLRRPPPFVEPDEVMAERVLLALRAICAEHCGERVLVVTSGSPI